jgi:hypothetical protein
VSCSSFALEEEPLTHNNSLLPLRWKGFTVDDLSRLKALTRSLGEASVESGLAKGNNPVQPSASE